MPRRPRPASRPPPQYNEHPSKRAPPAASVASSRKALPDPRSRPVYPDSTSDQESEHNRREDHDDESDDDEEDEGEFDEDIDADAPRAAQYVDEDELDEEEESESESDEDGAAAGPSHIKSLRNDLSSLPLGALRKAQQSLSRPKVLSDSENDDEGDDFTAEADSGSEPEELDVKDKRREVIAKAKKEIAKRPHKHAPMEMTSKRPVPRKKANIEDKKPVPRDPRFLHITGEFSADRFRSQYGFLSDMHAQEMKTLRDNLKRARKMLISSPRDLRAEREQEVERLERAVKRAESLVNRDKREKVEASALARVRQDEKEKRVQGKGAWYMKDADKKDLLVKAKFEALAKSGGRSAVRKAIEKKQKKVGQKEKKRRPYVPGEQRQGGRPQESRPHKRQRFS